MTVGCTIGPEFLLRTLTRFFDREEEMERFLKLMGQARVRLVTITGSGGAGKSRFAVEAVAEAVKRAGESGQVGLTAVFVPLAEVTDARRLFEVTLSATGAPARPELSDAEHLLDVLHSYANPILVFDTFEQLVPDGALPIRELMARCPSLKIVITSRKKLGVEGETELRLSPLPLPAAQSDPQDLLAVPSVALFVDRAQAAAADFALTPKNAQVIGELCRYLEGLPLAIELAAARVTLLTPSRILDHVQQDRFQYLSSRRPDTDDRQRTLGATLEWSFSLIDEVQRSHLEELSAFRGGWTLEAAQAVCDISQTEALDLMTALNGCSLIEVKSVTEGLRFALLENVRLFAYERLKGGGSLESVRQRHFTYFVRFIETGYGLEEGPRCEQFFDHLDSEYENLRLAKAFAMERGGSALDRALNACAILSLFWQQRGRTEDGRGHLRDLLGLSLGWKTPSRAAALVAAGELARLQRDFGTAKGYFTEALASWEELGDRHGAANTREELDRLAAAERHFAASAR